MGGVLLMKGLTGNRVGSIFLGVFDTYDDLTYSTKDLVEEGKIDETNEKQSRSAEEN